MTIKKNKVGKFIKKIRLLILDVDGVLTKGEIIYDDKGRELKIFNVKDGLGISLLAKIGISVIFLSARNSPILKKRALTTGVSEVIGGILPKEKMLEVIRKKYSVTNEEICYIGDDLIDIALIKKVGLGVAVNDSAPEVKKAARYITKKNGGEGAVREIIDMIIDQQRLRGKIFKMISRPLD